MTNSPHQPFLYGPDVAQTDTDDSPTGHGTCMASKAGGGNLGVASKANLVVVKAKPSRADNLWAFERIRDDVRFTSRQGKVVVLFARGATIFIPGEENTEPWPKIKSVMRELFALDVVIVTSSGNIGELSGHANIDLVPKI